MNTRPPSANDGGKLLFFDAKAAGARMPPHDLDAEAAVLSAALIEPNSLDLVLEFLKPEHFYAERHRRIFEACLELRQKGMPVDTIQVGSWLRSRERLEQIGGLGYLTSLLDVAPSIVNVEAYGKTVRDKWRARQLISACQALAAEGYGDYGDIQDFLDRAEQNVFAIGENPGAGTAVTLGVAIQAAFKKLSARFTSGRPCDGLETGFDRFDRLMGGLRDGELTIVAARPGMGKTSFILNLAANVARPRRFEHAIDPNERWEEPGAGVVIFSLEMPNEQLANRMLCCEAKVNIGKLNGGGANVSDWSLLTTTASEISRLPVWLDDAPGASLLEVRSRVRRIQAGYNQRGADGKFIRRVGLIVVDYLQLMRGNGKAGNREQEISELSRGLKGLAKEFSIPVIALSQLNRAVEARADKRPMISDLRESGAIEQDADNIVFLYRDEYYTKELCKCPGTVEVIVAKQRNGPTGMAMHKWSGEFTRFDNLPDGEFSE